MKDRIRSALGEIKTNHAGELSKQIWEVMDNNPEEYKWPDTKAGTEPQSNMSKARFSFKVAVAIIEDEQAAGRLSPGPLRRKNQGGTVQTDDVAKESADVSVAELVSAMDEVTVEDALAGADNDLDDMATDDATSLAISSVSPAEDSASAQYDPQT